MDCRALFENSKLILPETFINFSSIPWSRHPTIYGMDLKYLITSDYTDGQFSFYLVRFAPNTSIESHIHEGQIETHEVLEGNGICINNGIRLKYEPGVITVFKANHPHEIRASQSGLILLAKFFPALK